MLDWAGPDFHEPKDLAAHHRLEQLCTVLVRQCDDVSCPYGLLTDGARTLMLCLENPERRQIDPPTHAVGCHAFATTEYSVAYCVASILYRFSITLLPNPSICHGAMSSDPSSSYNEVAQSFRDFDLYQLQRNRDLFRTFLEWKARELLQARPISCGQLLLVERDILSRPPQAPGDLRPTAARLSSWRCPVNYVKTVPLESHQALSGAFRPRDSQVDEFLDCSDAMYFVVERVVQSGSMKFSQVAFGRLKCGERISDRPLCVKLFDERFFDVPTLQDYDRQSRPCERLSQLNFADQMLRREEAVYARLSEYQGTLLPHCYGFHEVRAPVLQVPIPPTHAAFGSVSSLRRRRGRIAATQSARLSHGADPRLPT